MEKVGVDGKHKLADKGFASVFGSHLRELNAPFHEATHKAGWFFTTNEAINVSLTIDAVTLGSHLP
ncbi:hypothetical protein HN51_025666, partial [Arachis hypogaea]